MTVFFNPRDEFLDWLQAHLGDRHAYDVGCGTGELLRRCWDRKIKIMGIDIRASEVITDLDTRRRVMSEDARRSNLLRTQPGLVLFCRPSHSGWVAETITKIHKDSEILYISKPGNRHVDLPRFTTQRIIAPGCRVERVYRVLPPYPIGPRAVDHQLFIEDQLRAMLEGHDFIGD